MMIIAASLGFSIVSMSQAMLSPDTSTSCTLLLRGDDSSDCLTAAPVPKGPITITCEMKAKCVEDCFNDITTNFQYPGPSSDDFKFVSDKTGSGPKEIRNDYHSFNGKMQFINQPHEVGSIFHGAQSGTVTCSVKPYKASFLKL